MYKLLNICGRKLIAALSRCISPIRDLDSLNLVFSWILIVLNSLNNELMHSVLYTMK